jgi:CheY-like chemotaxis protein
VQAITVVWMSVEGYGFTLGRLALRKAGILRPHFVGIQARSGPILAECLTCRLELAETYQYDLVILDLMFPSLAGGEVLKRIRKSKS